MAGADDFQAALRHELATLKCPLPQALASALVFPRAVRGRATLVHWRQADNTAADWAAAVRKRHGWCLEIPPAIFLLDLDHDGALELLAGRLPHGYGLVQSSPGKFHVWLCGKAPSGQHLGHLGSCTLEIHGPGRLATLPPSLHVNYGLPYRWLRPFLGNVPTRPEDLGIVLEGARAVKSPHHRSSLPMLAGGAPLHELMEQLTGQAGQKQGHDWAFLCPVHDDSHRSLMVNDDKALFFCHGAGCGWKGNRRTIENLAGMKKSPHCRVQIPTFEVRE